MGLHKTRAVVIGRRAFGEADRLVDFYTRDHGKVRGIARSARRPRSRFGSALELFTLGEMVFFDTGRSELVQVDHFDIVRPFVGVREHLERLGRGAWTVEVVARLSAERDPHPALFALLV
ncbi:MAG: DNA repair protein RecO, partial [Candidatus Rokuibacteriota bacterium]